MPLVPVVESTKNINRLMNELKLYDRAEQSIWTRSHGNFYITIQATMGETEEHQDLWHLTVKKWDKVVLDVSTPSLGEVLLQYAAVIFSIGGGVLQ